MLLVPKSWKDFQHYKDRRPPWIKLHKSLLDDRAFISLPVASKALAPLMWLLASETKEGVFEGSVEELAFRFRMSEDEVSQGLKPLLQKEFFLDASTMLAVCLQDAIPETERETESESEREAKSIVNSEQSEKKAKLNDQANEVFSYWLTVMNKDPAATKKTPERINKIKARLKQDYSVKDIKDAIDGCARSPFHMGDNPGGKKYNDIELICRNGKHLESFSDLPMEHEIPVSDKEKRKQLSNQVMDAVFNNDTSWMP